MVVTLDVCVFILLYNEALDGLPWNDNFYSFENTTRNSRLMGWKQPKNWHKSSAVKKAKEIAAKKLKIFGCATPLRGLKRKIPAWLQPAVTAVRPSHCSSECSRARPLRLSFTALFVSSWDWDCFVDFTWHLNVRSEPSIGFCYQVLVNICQSIYSCLSVNI